MFSLLLLILELNTFPPGAMGKMERREDKLVNHILVIQNFQFKQEPILFNKNVHQNPFNRLDIFF